MSGRRTIRNNPIDPASLLLTGVIGYAGYLAWQHIKAQGQQQQQPGRQAAPPRPAPVAGGGQRGVDFAADVYDYPPGTTVTFAGVAYQQAANGQRQPLANHTVQIVDPDVNGGAVFARATTGGDGSYQVQWPYNGEHGTWRAYALDADTGARSGTMTFRVNTTGVYAGGGETVNV